MASSRRGTMSPSKIQSFLEKENNMDLSFENSFPVAAAYPSMDSFDLYDMDIMSELVWNMTDDSIPANEKEAIAQEIESLSGYPKEALLQPTVSEASKLKLKEIDNSAKRELLMSLKPYLMKMNKMKEVETADLFKATGCKTFKDKDSGHYKYRFEETGNIISAEEYAERYVSFVEERRHERWSECAASCGWFRESRLVISTPNTETKAQTSSTRTFPTPSPLQPLEEIDQNRASFSPVRPKTMSKRKTLSPSQIKNWMDEPTEMLSDLNQLKSTEMEERLAESEGSVDQQPTETQQFFTALSEDDSLISESTVTEVAKSSKEAIYQKEVQEAEANLFAEWEAALARFHTSKEAAKKKLENMEV